MVKVRYWIRQLVEIDTDTTKMRVIQNYTTPAAGFGDKKPKKNIIKPDVAKASEVEYLWLKQIENLFYDWRSIYLLEVELTKRQTIILKIYIRW